MFLPRVSIESAVAQLFEAVYRDLRNAGYDHLQALRKTRETVLAVAQQQAQARTRSTEGFWNTMGTMFANASRLNDLDAQLNALVVLNL